MRAIAIVVIASIVSLAASTANAQEVEATAWRQVAEAIPLGSKVRVQTVEGQRVNGTLMRVDGTAIMLKRNTRRPEPARTVTFSEIAKLERDHGNSGMNIPKALGVGIAAGAGVFFSLVLIAMQMD
jgi:small nuclear ribonucleoprotein (snRNP)-like protein